MSAFVAHFGVLCYSGCNRGISVVGIGRIRRGGNCIGEARGLCIIYAIFGHIGGYYVGAPCFCNWNGFYDIVGAVFFCYSAEEALLM